APRNSARLALCRSLSRVGAPPLRAATHAGRRTVPRGGLPGIASGRRGSGPILSARFPYRPPRRSASVFRDLRDRRPQDGGPHPPPASAVPTVLGLVGRPRDGPVPVGIRPAAEARPDRVRREQAPRPGTRLRADVSRTCGGAQPAVWPRDGRL